MDDEALDATDLRPAGRFVYHVAGQQWEWDDEAFTIHGYRPQQIDPTTEAIMGHKHPQDRERVEARLSDAMADGAAFTIYYRIIVGAESRNVVLVGSGEYDEETRSTDGKVDRLIGYYIDLTPEMSASSSAAANAAVAASIAGRDTIEQAKGVLMLAYGLDADAAFAMLKWWSRNRNVKIREIAEWLVASAGSGDMTHPDLRHLLDALISDLTEDRTR